jgi:hypothetical protein
MCSLISMGSTMIRNDHGTLTKFAPMVLSMWLCTNVFSHPSFIFFTLLQPHPPIKLNLGHQINRWETTNSKPHGPTIKEGICLLSTISRSRGHSIRIGTREVFMPTYYRHKFLPNFYKASINRLLFSKRDSLEYKVPSKITLGNFSQAGCWFHNLALLQSWWTTLPY